MSIDVSSTIVLAWQSAAEEAVRAKHQYIEIEHIFIGLCKAMNIETMKKVGSKVDMEEIDLSGALFRDFGVEPESLGGKIRGLWKQGKYEQTEKVIHRSQTCQEFFKEAEKIASSCGASKTNSLHLLLAIMYEPGDLISQAISESGVEISKIKEKIIQILKKESCLSFSSLISEQIESEGLEKLREHFDAVYKVAEAINSILDLNTLLTRIIEESLKVIKFANRGFLMLLDLKTEKLKPAVIFPRSLKEVPVSTTIANEVISEKKSIRVLDAATDERFRDAGSVREFQIHSAIYAPLLDKENIIGVLGVYSTLEGHIFSEDDERLLMVIANQSAWAITNAYLHKELEESALLKSNLQRHFSPNVANRIMEIGKDREILLGEVKKVVATVLESDIRGFTRFCESEQMRNRPDLVVHILNDYLTAMAEVIFKYDGTIDKYIGDAILAVFGSPGIVEDKEHSLKAVQAGLEMMLRLEKLNQRFQNEWGIKKIEMGIGIHRGKIIHGYVGSPDCMSYTVIGDTVNTTSRLCDQAKGGEILISDDVWQEVYEQIEWEDKGMIEVKNKTNPLGIRRVISMKNGD